MEGSGSLDTARRQAILAMLERSPRSEFVWTSQVAKMLAGPEYQSFAQGEPREANSIRCRWNDIAYTELAALRDEGLVQQNAHLGWRLPGA